MYILYVTYRYMHRDLRSKKKIKSYNKCGQVITIKSTAKPVGMVIRSRSNLTLYKPPCFFGYLFMNSTCAVAHSLSNFYTSGISGEIKTIIFERK